jgi:hypothetical protein
MSIYKLTATSKVNSVNLTNNIEANSYNEAYEKALAFVNEYNNLGNGHTSNWVLQSVTQLASPAPEPVQTPQVEVFSEPDPNR